MKLIVLSTLIVISFVFASCNQSSDKAKNDVIAEINGIEISSSELDKLVQQELFDESNRIYNIRDIALSELIKAKILEQEASKNNLTVPEYIRQYTDLYIKKYSFDSLVHKYQIDGTANMIYKTAMVGVPIDSYEGRLNQKNSLEYLIQSKLVDSLINKSNVKIFLFPPKSPHINMDKYAIAYRGNEESNVTMYIISDFDCGKCVELHPIYNNIYNKYKDRVNFGYVNYSGSPSPLIIASEGMNNQGKFWEFHDTAFNIDTMIDSTRIFRIADSLQVNMGQFTNDFNSSEMRNRIAQKFTGIENAGIYATPTIVVNNRLLFNSGSYEEIAKLIDFELNKQ